MACHLKLILEVIWGKLIWKVPRQEVGVTACWDAVLQAGNLVQSNTIQLRLRFYYWGISVFSGKIEGCCSLSVSKSTPTFPHCDFELLLAWNESGRASPRQLDCWFPDWRQSRELLCLCGFLLISCKSRVVSGGRIKMFFYRDWSGGWAD